jgi:osmoprotectant transport system substrate-binding protein
MYRLVLQDAGFDVPAPVSVTNRETYAKSLKSGEIDVIPEYAASMADYLNLEVNGADAGTVASPYIDKTMQELRSLAEQQGYTVLEPAKATDQNAFAVSKEFAAANDLTTLSDLGAMGEPVTLAAPVECSERPYCKPGLEKVYGIEVADLITADFGSLQAKKAVQTGDADLCLLGTTDGSLEEFGLVVLEDDKNLQNSENLVPIVNEEAAAEPTVAEVLNELSATLTTEDLAMLNGQVDLERQKPETVAEQYLQDKGLIGG